jgi:hypothetical protein
MFTNVTAVSMGRTHRRRERLLREHSLHLPDRAQWQLVDRAAEQRPNDRRRRMSSCAAQRLNALQCQRMKEKGSTRSKRCPRWSRHEDGQKADTRHAQMGARNRLHGKNS